MVSTKLNSYSINVYEKIMKKALFLTFCLSKTKNTSIIIQIISYGVWG